VTAILVVVSASVVGNIVVVITAERLVQLTVLKMSNEHIRKLFRIIQSSRNPL